MKLKETLENYMFVLPATLIFGIFYVIPFIWVFQLGLYDWDGILPTKVFVGLANFQQILFEDKIWWQSMRQVGYITLIALTFQNMLAFLLAWACDREIRMKNFYRV
ncbi:MAG: sugar ABC transporter permease, partial [Candidatus Omnitrophica bacterium]|nr:sugar ABC transporter permease [Candidatus Omnitrophota bacterium]